METGDYIRRVHPLLFNTNPEAYTPKMISIGPYHMNEPSCLENKRIKEYYKNHFFEGRNGSEVGCRDMLSRYCHTARSWYADRSWYVPADGEAPPPAVVEPPPPRRPGGAPPPAPRLTDRQFIDMLLLDGCFILQLIDIRLHIRPCRDDDPFLNVDANLFQTLIDVVLMENQVPFFVLFKLYEQINPNHNDAQLLKTLIERVRRCYRTQVPKFTPYNLYRDDGCRTDPLAASPKHLLQVMHRFCIPDPIPRDGNGGRDGNYIYEQLNSTATELEEISGVSLEKIGKIYLNAEGRQEDINYNAADRTTLFDIDFKSGKLHIPSFRISSYTMTFLRNMVAYEQSDTSGERIWYFSEFLWFMSQLIGSSADASLLRRIRSTWLGKLRHEWHYSPWNFIYALPGVVIVLVGLAVSIKKLFFK